MPTANATVERAARAFRAGSFPCNPRPFLAALSALVESDGPGALAEPKGKAILWVLMGQAFGQCARIDLYDLYVELDDTIPRDMPDGAA